MTISFRFWTFVVLVLLGSVATVRAADGWTAARGVERILAMQVNGDGLFEVICRDLTRDLATASDIRADRVCWGSGAPGGTLKPGLYQPDASLPLFCPHLATMSQADSNGVRTLTLLMQGACDGKKAELRCLGGGCTGSVANDGSNPVTVTIKDEQHYQYKDLFGVIVEYRYAGSMH